tara:strand:- start:376 stop:663 length:288 start_codon:yes stop_codon:yes gene_type:complete
MPSVIAGTHQDPNWTYKSAAAVTASATKDASTLLDFDALQATGNVTATVSLEGDTTKDTAIQMKSGIVYPMKVRYVTSVVGFGTSGVIGLKKKAD